MTKARDLANSAAAFAAVSATELGYVDGVTSAIQTQMDAKAPSSTAVTLTGTQTLTNKTLTSPVIASVINNTLTSTTGDIIYASGANTPARLGIGSTGNVLTVSGGLPVWSAPAGGGKVLQVVTANITTDTTISTTTYADTSLTATITPTLNTSKILVLFSLNCRLSTTANDTVGFGLLLVRGATTIADLSAGTNSRASAIQATADGIPTLALTGYTNYNFLDSPATTSATAYKVQAAINSTAASRSARFQIQNMPSVITLMEIGA